MKESKQPPLAAQVHPAEARLFAAMLAMHARTRSDFERFMLKVLAPIGSDK